MLLLDAAGSGKTAAFALPLLERLLYRSRRVPAIYVLVLTPTRELAVQVQAKSCPACLYHCNSMPFARILLIAGQVQASE